MNERRFWLQIIFYFDLSILLCKNSSSYIHLGFVHFTGCFSWKKAESMHQNKTQNGKK